MTKHKENCLIINGKQSVKLKSGSITFKNCFKQLPVPFSHKNNGSCTKKYQDHIPCSFADKFVCVDNKFSKRVLPYREKKMLFTDLLKQLLKSMIIVKTVIEERFNKNIIMSPEVEEKFQLTNSCWICDKLFHVRDNKIRDHCHITGKYRSAAHWSCNINFKLTQNIPVTFHNQRGYKSHLIIKETSKFDVKVSVIQNGLEKYMPFTNNTDLVFIDSMQCMNFSLDSLLKNLWDNDFKYFSEEFNGEFLKLVK